MSKLFGDNLRNYRMLNRMTQTDLANAAGITRSAVNNYEAAKSEPNFEILCKFADILGVEITDLVVEHSVYPDMMRRMVVTDDEAAVLQAYRKADPVFRQAAFDILRVHKGGA